MLFHAKLASHFKLPMLYLLQRVLDKRNTVILDCHIHFRTRDIFRMLIAIHVLQTVLGIRNSKIIIKDESALTSVLM